MTPVEAMSTSRWRQSSRLAMDEATRRAASAPGPAGEGVGATGVDDQRAHPLPARRLQLPLAPIDGRGADAVAGEDAGAVRAVRKAHQQEVVALAACRNPPGAVAISTPAMGGISGNGTARGEIGKPLLGDTAGGAGASALARRALQRAGQGVEGALERLADAFGGICGVGLVGHGVWFCGAGGSERGCGE